MAMFQGPHDASSMIRRQLVGWALPRRISAWFIGAFVGGAYSTLILAGEDRLAGSADFVGAADRRGVRRVVQEVGVFFGDAEEDFSESVERFFAFRLSGLDHDRFFDGEREVNRWGMKAEVEQ